MLFVCFFSLCGKNMLHFKLKQIQFRKNNASIQTNTRQQQQPQPFEIEIR